MLLIIEIVFLFKIHSAMYLIPFVSMTVNYYFFYLNDVMKIVQRNNRYD